MPFVSPRLFASLAGFASPDRPTDEATSRSVGARDIALGVGILTVALGPASPAQSAQLAPWIFARLLCDAGDTAALALAIHRGARNPRLLTLLTLALAATTCSTTLLTLIRRPPAGSGAAPRR